MGRHLCLWIGRFNIKMAILHKSFYRFKTILKIAVCFSQRLTSYAKIHAEIQTTRTAKTTLKRRTTLGGFIFPSFKICYGKQDRVEKA